MRPLVHSSRTSWAACGSGEDSPSMKKVCLRRRPNLGFAVWMMKEGANLWMRRRCILALCAPSSVADRHGVIKRAQTRKTAVGLIDLHQAGCNYGDKVLPMRRAGLPSARAASHGTRRKASDSWKGRPGRQHWVRDNVMALPACLLSEQRTQRPPSLRIYIGFSQPSPLSRPDPPLVRYHATSLPRVRQLNRIVHSRRPPAQTGTKGSEQPSEQNRCRRSVEHRPPKNAQ